MTDASSLGGDSVFPPDALDLLIHAGEGTLQFRRRGSMGLGGQAEGRPDGARVRAREQKGRAVAEFGDLVAVALGDPFDEAVEAKPPQVVGHATLPERLHGQAEQGGEVLAKRSVREAPWTQTEDEQGVEQRLDAGIAEAKPRGALPRDLLGWWI